MGEPAAVWEERIHDLLPYQVNKAAMDNAAEGAVFMHCLPAFHDLNTGIGKEISEKFGLTEMEVTDEVFESSQSIVFDEAENRMHTIKAVIAATIYPEVLLRYGTQTQKMGIRADRDFYVIIDRHISCDSGAGLETL